MRSVRRLVWEPVAGVRSTGIVGWYRHLAAGGECLCSWQVRDNQIGAEGDCHGLARLSAPVHRSQPIRLCLDGESERLLENGFQVVHRGAEVFVAC